MPRPLLPRSVSRWRRSALVFLFFFFNQQLTFPRSTKGAVTWLMRRVTWKGGFSSLTHSAQIRSPIHEKICIHKQWPSFPLQHFSRCRTSLEGVSVTSSAYKYTDVHPDGQQFPAIWSHNELLGFCRNYLQLKRAAILGSANHNSVVVIWPASFPWCACRRSVVFFFSVLSGSERWKVGTRSRALVNRVEVG